ncbi:unnamed protein product [Orchesella dallaii]|uniref:Uncharacterized protein n=1 Tax=Orchesella dallaii TaxID=48710 RepID=A0ABP1QYN4_9HEXA
MSRGFLSSHNLMGKSVIQLNCSGGIAAVGMLNPSLGQIMAVAKQKPGETTSVEDQDTSALRRKPSQQQPKQFNTFNTSAKDILNTRDEESIPSMISATPAIAIDRDQAPLHAQ